jgi:hypothetical protein
MDDQQPPRATDRDRVVSELRELIDALDRRVAHIERVGEIEIAREAAALKREALTRIEALTRRPLDRPEREAALADAVMTDDGAAAVRG